MKLVSIVFDKTASEYKLYYKDEKTGKPYHITANHLLDKEKLWAQGANYYQDPYRIIWTVREAQTMAIKLCEHTYGTHIYMRLKLDNGRIEEVDAYTTENGMKYHTSADNNPDFPKPEIRAQIIAAFNALY